MASGENPLNGEPIEDGSFLHDPRIIRCLYFVQEVLAMAADGHFKSNTKKNTEFVITYEEKVKVQFPQGNIGVNEFARCVNMVIDLDKSKRLSGVEINKQLKKMGILGEDALADGKTRTILTNISKDYGIESERRSYNGNEYEMVVFTDEGKKYLLDNIEKIMNYNE